MARPVASLSSLEFLYKKAPAPTKIKIKTADVASLFTSYIVLYDTCMSNGENYDEWLKQKLQGGAHYYGDTIRKYFLAAGFMLVALIPFDRELFSFYISFGIAFIIITIILAGLTNPKSQSVIIADFVLALVLGCIFEYLAVEQYFRTSDFFNLVFLLRQAIAALAFIALYLSTKTLRGMFYKDKS